MYLIFRSFNGSGSAGMTGAGLPSEPCFFMFSVEKFAGVPETQVKWGIKGIQWFLPWLSSWLYLCFFIWTSHGIFAYRNMIGWKNHRKEKMTLLIFMTKSNSLFSELRPGWSTCCWNNLPQQTLWIPYWGTELKVSSSVKLLSLSRQVSTF